MAYKPVVKPKIKIKALLTFPNLNTAMLRANEARCLVLLAAEQNGRKRKAFMHRIHSRLNRLQHGRGRGPAKKA